MQAHGGGKGSQLVQRRAMAERAFLFESAVQKAPKRTIAHPCWPLDPRELASWTCCSVWFASLLNAQGKIIAAGCGLAQWRGFRPPTCQDEGEGRESLFLGLLECRNRSLVANGTKIRTSPTRGPPTSIVPYRHRCTRHHFRYLETLVQDSFRRLCQ